MMDDGAKRRLAVQLAGQLPEDAEDAVAVLELAIELTRTFLLPSAPLDDTHRAADQDDKVMSFCARRRE